MIVDFQRAISIVQTIRNQNTLVKHDNCQISDIIESAFLSQLFLDT